MSEFRRICCPIDFSDPCRQALDEAVHVARRYGAGLTVLHVAHSAWTGPGTGFAPPPRSPEEGASARLDAWRDDAERMVGGAVSGVLLSGPTAEAIVGFARDTGVDLIVLASHGRGGFRRLVLGSVAESVIRTAPCDVLVVRRPEPPRAEVPQDPVSGMPA